MRRVVTLELEACAVLCAGGQHMFDVGEGVAKHQVARTFQVLTLPGMHKFLVPLEHRKEPDVHRTHVQRRHLGFKTGRGQHTLLRLHVGAAAGRQVDDRLCARVDLRQKAGKGLGRLVGPAVDRVARMQVQDGRARLGRSHRLIGDLLRRDRQVRRHRRRVDRTRHRTSDDDLAWRLRVRCHRTQACCALRFCALRIRPRSVDGLTGIWCTFTPCACSASSMALLKADGAPSRPPSPPPLMPNSV